MKTVLEPGAYLPTRAHPTDAGLDLYAMEGQIVPARESAKFNTGFPCSSPRTPSALYSAKAG